MPPPRKAAVARTEEARALERARDLPNARTALDVDALRRAFADHLQYSQGKDEHTATPLDRYFAVAYAVRDRMMRRWIQTQQTYYKADAKRVYYLSLEFLMGKALENNLLNLGIYDNMRSALSDLGLDLNALLEQEPDAGLGNGGLGRLAACFLDSLATLSIPAYGYGIRYEFGIFDQEIRNGYQVERPEEWLRFGSAWEIPRGDACVPVSFYGRTEHGVDEKGRLQVRWADARHVLGMPYDVPITGHGNQTVNTLRLWRARASQELDLADFNAGDYLSAVEEKDLSENISKVLYPNDLTVMGKELRLQQQYFFVCCSIHDIVNRHLKMHEGFSDFPDKVAIQMNDTHPAIAVAELMRVLVDEHGLEWGKAWEICGGTFGYTNHTLMPEALEKWSVDLFGRVLPRHLEIVFEVNRRFLDGVRAARKADEPALQRMSLIEEGPVKQVRMANLAVIGSHSVNGVAALHTELLKRELFHDFHALWPERFNNKTNGVTPRRWLLQANPALARSISEVIGPGWVTDAAQLRNLEPLAEDAGFRRLFRDVKRDNKERLAGIVRVENGISLDLDSIFDVQVKRIHEYKRQLLAILRVASEYLRLKEERGYDPYPRSYLFGGKAAPGYAMAKWIIKLVGSVADVVNRDVDVRGRIAVAFLRNYRVSLAERIFPAAEVSEQISTAGKEASGTGNMKFALNGALTVGTLDGANVEIREEVGAENFFLFGLTVEEVAALRKGGYDPWEWYRKDRRIKQVLDALSSGVFSPGEPGLFRPVVESLLNGGDPYLVLADFAAYCSCQERVEQAYRDPDGWTRKAILNVARAGKFSSDRTIHEYATEIWNVPPVRVVE
ncbi:glycogen/starch/alpha-glucan phosphorylase [Anaeromyxobacter dehalogenans 2CP-1]|uniref:Alpha-1,4 glucan phosphorylase n=1 Tax=Anaeromyxobacter dehalogenans (strain ATCC BAA-258 / DSM 21875 / 2CP-1) TaxID=455488 RepID=B8JED9_ANAD2|nr:glycogen/starch/alpha-glucan phosphorylase [Anaeromyxobacter dehalogenans]ACL64265.1 glycogen/starch/alpha-glucan phosphorylase [Anaeromyxobacter dehalogenans 2CP-1]